ncbi:putative ATP-grasp-modified RiPP [Kribbella sp. NPDC023972]|uniref:putative ATP-grasp-modified RiPP n=1 Tax=Kribbella sp. NPDC023972 TaxID=3154795 RepID=UPI0033EC7AB0
MHDEQIAAPVVPWALGRATERVHTVELDYVRVDVDPVTQMGRYWAEDGTRVEPIEAGKHGRITNTYTRTATSGDGGKGGGKQDSDTNMDGRPD